MAKAKITHREFLLARAFLKKVGANVQNTYLLLAIVAWTRAMGKAHDPFWNGLRNASAASAGTRLAQNLINKSKVSKYAAEYKAILYRMRQQLGGTSAKAQAAMAAQAVDVLLGINKSHYDSKHYGYHEATDGHLVTKWVYSGRGYPEQVTTWVPATAFADPLTASWAALTNHPNIPDSWWVTTTKTTTVRHVPARPHQPRSLQHVQPRADYIQPYAAVTFYDAKPHYGSNLLLDD